MSTRIAFLVLIAIFSLVACSGSSDSSKPNGSLPEAEITLTLEQTIGGGDDPALLLGGVSGIAVDDSGTILIADRQNHQVWLVGSDGEMKGSFGGEGEGPGEFQRVGSPVIGSGDSLYIFDTQLDRISTFSPGSYQYVHSVTLSGYEDYTPMRLLAVSKNSFLIGLTQYYSADNAFEEHFTDVMKFTLSGDSIPATKKAFSASESLVHVEEQGGNSSLWVSSKPFGRQRILEADHEGRLYTGWSETLEIDVIAPDGSVERQISHAITPIPVTQAELDSLIESRTSRIDNSESQKRFRKMYREADFSDTKPAFTDLLVEGGGKVWVQLSTETSAEEVTWLVFEHDGTPVGRVSLPKDVMLHVVKNDTAYGVRTGKMGQEEVVIYRIDPDTL